MQNVTFRPFTKSDRKEYLDLLGSIWHYTSYSDDAKVREMLVKLDGFAALHASAYQEVAVYDGRLAGVLFAAPKGKFRRLHFVKYTLKLMWLFMRLLVHSKDSRRSLLNLKRILRAYESLTKKSRHPHRNEVTLFMVDSDFRGKHIGITLLERYETFLKKKGQTHYYLFTDEKCSYTFYDHHGFTLDGQQTVQEKLKDGPSKMRVMLYAKRMDAKPPKNEEA